MAETGTVARELFAPLGPTYDRYANLLSFGQDPRWRRFLVSRVGAGPDSRVLDVATGTAAVAIELVRQHGCTVVGIDQSPDMLGTGRARVERAASATASSSSRAARRNCLRGRVLRRADLHVPAPLCRRPCRDARRAGPGREAGGTIAGLEFGVPPIALWRGLWELWVRIGLPGAGRVISPGWSEVGDFLGPSIRGFYARYPLPELGRLWNAAGIRSVRWQGLSLGGGVVTWGRRA